MSDRSPDYSRIAPTYDDRYRANPLAGVGEALTTLARGASRVLEVGCGTGHWLARLRSECGFVVGLDLSRKMLNKARERGAPRLVRGRGEGLPFASESFDLVFCVNALCHFAGQREFVGEAHRLLRPGGTVAVIGSNPRGRLGQCWVYDCFEGTYEMDLARFPAWEEVAEWMRAEGFAEVTCQPVERIYDPKVGRAMLCDPFLQKNSCSQLALLTDEAYAAGVRRIEAAITEAEAQGESAVFPFDLTLAMVSGAR
jgi:SAM-dependent methyltransferase